MLTEKLIAGSLIDEEINLEIGAVQNGVARYRRMVRQAIEREEGSQLKPAERLMAYWFDRLRLSIREDQKSVRRGEVAENRAMYGPVMIACNADKQAVIAMAYMLRLCMLQPSGARFTKIAGAIGRGVLAEIAQARLSDDGYDDIVNKLAWKYQQNLPSRILTQARRRMPDDIWHGRYAYALGAQLISHVITSCCRHDDPDRPYEPAFEHNIVIQRSRGRAKRRGVLTMHREVHDMIDEGVGYRAAMWPIWWPMIIHPVSWENGEGGYYKQKTGLLLKSTRMQRELLAAADLSGVHECLDAVNDPAYSLNEAVLEQIESDWSSGGGVCGIPAADNKPIPPRPPEADSDKAVHNRWRRQAAEIHLENSQEKGQRMVFLTKLHMIREMGRRDRFWQSHGLDYRSRCYPHCSDFSHQGSDIDRGVIRFADSRPVTDDGRWWVYIQAANCYGMSQVSFDERVDWAHEQARSVDWREADDPYQFLAARMAMDDNEAAAHLPVHQDGSCNGLQHYSALGRDEMGGRAVNLLDGPEPERIYRDVAEIVSRRVRDDAERGHGLAQMLDGRVTDKVAKHPVMTCVYGVTSIGAKDQVYAQLKKHWDGEEEDLQDCAWYVSQMVLEAVREVCPKAVAIMDWMREVARIICGEHKKHIQWTTPLGFPVLQREESGMIQVQTVIQRMDVARRDSGAEPNLKRQANAFPANFVHSIDATHMLRTARSCRQHGIAFSAVHDSFATHAEDVGLMRTILRDEFVDMHAQPLLDNLHGELEELIDDELPKPPARGNLNVEDCRDATYLFN